jgi:hypothetical protein
VVAYASFRERERSRPQHRSNINATVCSVLEPDIIRDLASLGVLNAFTLSPSHISHRRALRIRGAGHWNANRVIMRAMARRPASHYGVAPRERAPAQAPEERAVAHAPGGHPMAQAKMPVVGRAPKEQGVRKPPNPRKPRLVREVDGGRLNDLFAVFPDLPFPHRPAANFGRKRGVRSGRTAPRASGRRVR